MQSRGKVFAASILWLFCLGAASAQEAAPDPYRSWPAITAAHEVGPGPAPLSPTDGFSFSGEGDSFFQTEATKPDNTTVKGTVFNETNLFGHFDWSDWLTLNTGIKYEHQRFNNELDYFPDRSSFMRSEGLTLRQLYVTARPDGTDDLSLYGGKFHPKFGTAWSYNGGQGIFYNFGNDYEQEEMIGFGADAKIPSTPTTSWLGEAHISAETYFQDTTFFSNSLFGHPSVNDMFVDRPGAFHLPDGGAANTNDLSSVTVALQGRGPLGLADAAYQFSFTHDGVHLPGEQSQTGVTGAVSYALALTDDLSTSPFAEYAWLDNFNGQDGLSRNYLTTGLATSYGRWEFDVVGGFRDSNDHMAGITVWDYQANASLTYAVMERLLIGGGFNHTRINSVGSNTLALTASYAFSL